MLSLHHLEGGTFTLIEISVIKVLFLSPIPQTELVSEEHIARRDTCKNAHIDLKALVLKGYRSRLWVVQPITALKSRFAAIENP